MLNPSSPGAAAAAEAAGEVGAAAASSSSFRRSYHGKQKEEHQLGWLLVGKLFVLQLICFFRKKSGESGSTSLFALGPLLCSLLPPRALNSNRKWGRGRERGRALFPLRCVAEEEEEEEKGID